MDSLVQLLSRHEAVAYRSVTYPPPKQLHSLVGKFHFSNQLGAVRTHSSLWILIFMFLLNMGFNKSLYCGTWYYLIGVVYYAEISMALIGRYQYGDHYLICQSFSILYICHIACNYLCSLVVLTGLNRSTKPFLMSCVLNPESSVCSTLGQVFKTQSPAHPC